MKACGRQGLKVSTTIDRAARDVRTLRCAPVLHLPRGLPQLLFVSFILFCFLFCFVLFCFSLSLSLFFLFTYNSLRTDSSVAAAAGWITFAS